MPGLLTLWDALRAGFNSFRSVIANPEQASTPGGSYRRAQYMVQWANYANNIFENETLWRDYIAEFRLYANIRSLYNPTTRAVDFYAGAVYPGRLSADGANLPEGVQNAIPLPADTPQEIRAALAQIWLWSNWLSKAKLMIRYAGVTGNCLVEIIDDVIAQKISYSVVWPGLVDEVELDEAGNLTYYAIEYETEEYADDGRPNRYTYRREVDKREIRTYKDDELYAYDNVPAVSRNTWGFVPAVWVKHKDLGGEWGAPAVPTSNGKIDEINSTLSHIFDYMHGAIENPWVMWTSGEIVPAFTVDNDAEPDENAQTLAEDLRFLKGPENGSIDTLVGTLSLAEALPYIAQLITEVKDDLPELSLYSELRDMQQVTGPGGVFLVGDVNTKYEEVSANHDTASVSLFRMALGMGGERLRRGDWRNPTALQEVFRPFDLDSYGSGAFTRLAILPRPLIPLTVASQLETQTKRAALANQIEKFVSEDEVYRTLGYDEAKIKQIKSEKDTASSAPPPPQ